MMSKKLAKQESLKQAYLDDLINRKESQKAQLIEEQH